MKKEKSKKNKNKKLCFSASEKGFTLIEGVISIAIVGIALLGLAQMFTFSVLNNSKADKMSTATFLAQQQIDNLRNLTTDELAVLTSNIDEQIDMNSDGFVDYRRVTVISNTAVTWEIKILIFSGPNNGISLSQLISNPIQNRVQANIGTVITR